MDTVQDQYEKTVKQQVERHYTLIEISPDTFQMVVPYFHDDGDMIEIYLRPTNGLDENTIITDLGMTLMRLSFTEDIEELSIQEQIDSTVNSQRIDFNDDEFSLICDSSDIISVIGSFAQFISKIVSITQN
ncbi:MAG: DUF1828 domain-containing protein [Fastidiosipilaceae bacterium]|jgi:hypothetical protein